MHHVISFLLRVAYALGFAFILLFHTEDIINYIPQLLGGLIMLEAVGQMLELFLLKIKTSVNWWFFAAPGAVLLYSLFLIFLCNSQINDLTTIREAFSPSHGFSWTTFQLYLGGWCFVIFLISECVISVRFFKPLYQPEKFAEEERIRKEAERQQLEREKQLEKERNAAEKEDRTEKEPETGIRSAE